MYNLGTGESSRGGRTWGAWKSSWRMLGGRRGGGSEGYVAGRKGGEVCVGQGGGGVCWGGRWGEVRAGVGWGKDSAGGKEGGEECVWE